MSLKYILKELNIPDGVIKQFEDINIRTVMDLMQWDAKTLKSRLSLTNEVVNNIKDCILTQHASVAIIGTDLYEETFRLTKIISTGCSNLDTMLDGGIYTRELLEVYGKPAAGKTQLAMTIAYHVIAHTPLNVLYLDTTSSFSMERIMEIHTSNNVQPSSPQELKSLLSKMVCCRLLNANEVIAYLELLKEKLASEQDPFCLKLKLIVLDSIASVITPILGGESRLGYILSARIASLLKEIAFDYGIAVMMLNNAVLNFVDKRFDDGRKHNKYKPTLGVTWLPVPSVRLFLDVVNSERRMIRIDKHARMVSRSFTYVRLTKKGFVNAD